MNTHYLCLKTSKRWQTRKGWVYAHEDGEMVHYSTRWQTRLLNAGMMIAEPGLFQAIPDRLLRQIYRHDCDCEDCRASKGAA